MHKTCAYGFSGFGRQTLRQLHFFQKIYPITVEARLNFGISFTFLIIFFKLFVIHISRGDDTNRIAPDCEGNEQMSV
jgi:hypothetical protein